MNFRYVIKELRHHHHRTLVNILGIAIGIALFVSINAVSTAYQKAVSTPFKNLGADLVIQKPEKRASRCGADARLHAGHPIAFFESTSALRRPGKTPLSRRCCGYRLSTPALGVRPGRLQDDHGR